jgi:stearoyl-CoA desaturase (delta-9 desaturase)
VFAVFMMATGLSITAGYHRLWCHRAYEAHPAVRLFFAVLGACAIQNSILHWSADHRKHHRFVDDRDLDPYPATRGFWFSHMGWILREYDHVENDFSNVKDLSRDPICVWQHKHYFLLVGLTNIALPLGIGFLHGKLWGTLVLAGLLRMVLNHHFTFFINSIAHIWGRRTYSENNTARDNGLIAYVTYGEGFHNFHHRFQYDYRNGVRWWHFDPTKWLIKTCSWLGLTWDLKQTSKFQIEKARLALQFSNAMAGLQQGPEADNWRQRLQEGHDSFVAKLDELSKFSNEWAKKLRDEKLLPRLDKTAMKQRYSELKKDLQACREEWRGLTSQLSVQLA